MNQYRVERASGGGRGDDPVPLCGDVTAESWPTANALAVDDHPWRDGGRTPSAVVRLLYDDDALYLQFRVEDDRIQAAPRERHGEVWRDSCVELFASPRPDRPEYFNFEANCLGQFRLGFGPHREERRLAPATVTDEIRVETSIAGASKEPSPADDGWWLAAALPFDALATFAGADVAPTAGTRWPANVYCCRGEPEPRYVVWSPIDSAKPDFHRPADFGRFTFG